MNVLILAPELLPVCGGVGTYIVELAKNLKNIDVHVIAPNRTINENSTKDYDLNEIFPDNVHLNFVGNAKENFFYNAKFQYNCYKKVPSYIKNNEIDLIHSHTAHMPDLILNNLKNIPPIITTVHSTIKGQRTGTKSSKTSFRNLQFSEKMTYGLYPLLRLSEENYFRKPKSFIAVSNWMKKRLLSEKPFINEKDIFVVHNCVDTSRFSPDNKELSKKIFPELAKINKTKILFSSRFLELKGISYLKKAIPHILKESDVHFIFAGSGNIKLNLPKENFTLLNYVDYTKIPYLYSVSDIHILPSMHENLPFSLLESMSSGISTISTTVGGIPEIMNSENGILIKPGDTEGIISSILTLSEDRKLREKLGKKSRETIMADFSSEKCAIKTHEAYYKTLNG